MASVDVRHDGLGRFERVFAPTTALAEARAEALRTRWRSEFASRSGAAETDWHALSAILIHAVRSAPTLDGMLDAETGDFDEPAPASPLPPVHDPEPQSAEFPRAKLTLATFVTPGGLRRRREAADAKYTTAHDSWRHLKRWRDSEYDKLTTAHRAALAAWKEREAAFRARQALANAYIADLVAGYRNGDPAAIEGLCHIQLLALERPKGFPTYWTLSFADGVVSIDYDLPNLDVVPLIKARKYVAARDSFEMSLAAAAERERLYAETVIQSTLAALHAVFLGDGAHHIRAVAFNGWANYIDGAALKPGRACILSLTADKPSFLGYDLMQVDPAACFKALNGTMSARLAAMLAQK